MQALTVGSSSNLARSRAQVIGVDKTISTINGDVYTLNDIVDISIGATATGQTSNATADVINVNRTDSQVTFQVTSGTFALNETVRFDTPFISDDDEALLTVGAVKTNPDLLAGTASNVVAGLAGKVDWAFFGYDGSVQYGANVVVSTRNTVILFDNAGVLEFYRLNNAAALPYTIDGTFANDLPNFEVLQGLEGIRGDRGLPGVAGVGQQYTWRTVDNTATGQDLAIVAQDAVYADTRNGTIAFTLPAEPSPNDIFAITDLYGSWPENNVQLVRNGRKIMNLEEDMFLTVFNAEYEFVYVNDDFGWRIQR